MKMMPRAKAILSFWGVMLLCLCPALVRAQLTDSAFENELYSRVQSSLLSANPALYEHDYLCLDEGLSHPFESIRTFRNSLKDALLPGTPKRNLISYRHPPLTADFNIIAGYEADFTESGDYGFLYKGWRLTAKAGKHLRMNTLWYNGAFYQDLDAAENDALIDGYCKPFEDHIQLDNLHGSIGFFHDYGTLALGRGRFQIGNTISGSIVLNDQVNDYGYLLAEGQIGAFRLSMLHGSLMADSTYSIYDNDYVNNRHYPQKYIALHQLSFDPGPVTELFVGESIIYGNRSMDLNYLLPNSFWRAVEHDLWDRDNVMIYAGFNHNLPGGTLIYTQFALDEFSYGKFFSSWWGNKYAIQSGISIPTSFARLSLEATAVRPYTYAHFTNHTMYSHDQRCLGYPQGSNVLDLSFEANIPWQDYLQLDTQLSYRKRGSVGASWQENYHDTFAGQIDDATAEWFEGETSDEYQIQSSLSIPILAHHSFLLGHDSLKTQDWQHQLFVAWQFDF
jgi:hypothetical protein